MENKEVALTRTLLDDKFQTLAESNKDKSFLINLIKFLDFYFTNETIVDNVCNILDHLKQEALNPLQEASEKRKENIITTFEIVKAHFIKINSKELVNPNFIDFENYIKGSLQGSRPLVESLAKCLHWLMNTSLDINNFQDKFFCQFAQINELGNFEQWSYDIFLDEYDDQTRIYERKKAISLWDQQEQLYTFFDIYHNYEDRKLELQKEQQLFGSMGLSLYYSEIDNVLNEKPLHNNVFFKRDKIIEDIKALYLFAKEKLSLVETSSSKPLLPQIKLVSGTPFFGILLNDTKVSFQNNSFSFDVLRYLLKNQSNKKKEWQYAELSKEMGYADLTKKEVKDKYYKACWDINEKIKRQTQIEDILIFNKLQVKVNSLITLS